MLKKTVKPSIHSRRCAQSDCVALWQLHFQYGGQSCRIRQILAEHSVKVRPFLFPFTIDKCNLIYSEFVKVFFVRICRVFYGSEGQTRSLFFLVCNMRPYFEKVKFDVRRSLEPFKDLGGRFDLSLTALTKRCHRSQTLSDGICVSRILSDGV